MNHQNIFDPVCLIHGLPASSPELLGLFERLLTAAFWEDLIPKTGTGSRQGID